MIPEQKKGSGTLLTRESDSKMNRRTHNSGMTNIYKLLFKRYNELRRCISKTKIISDKSLLLKHMIVVSIPLRDKMR